MSGKERILLVCPGRGSYDRSCLRSLQERSPSAQAMIQACDRIRESMSQPTLTDIDNAEGFKTSLHVAGEHSSLLTFACSMADYYDLNPDAYEIVGVLGNSMGFYTALAVSGALSLESTIRLVNTMGFYQTGRVVGGQLLYPICSEDWTHSSALEQDVESSLHQAKAEGHHAYWSIRLGGFAVLGADKGGIKHLQKTLPAIKRGTRTFPLQLPLHSAFHTPLMQSTSEQAIQDLDDLEFQAPSIPLIDGRGFIFRPKSTDPHQLGAYTLDTQIVTPFDFSTALSTALAHCGPDRVVTLGPGNSLGGPIARLLVENHWAGTTDKAMFDQRKPSDALLLSFGVAKQRDRLL